MASLLCTFLNAGGKQYVLKKWRRGSLVAFGAQQRHKQGQAATRYDRWAKEVRPYDVEYQQVGQSTSQLCFAWCIGVANHLW